MIVLAGPSGSGKSRLARRLGLPTLQLDDFYKNADDPTLPRRGPEVDWESPDAWDREGAVAALLEVATTGTVQVPEYSFSLNRAVGSRTVDLSGAPYVVAEGLFAAEILGKLRDRGVLAVAIVLANPPAKTLIRRLVRDASDHRKPLSVILRVGWLKYRTDPGIVRALVAAGATPMTNAAAESYLRGLHEPRRP